MNKDVKKISTGFVHDQDIIPPSDTPVTMLKRIGSTTYRVAVYFSQTSKETMDDKIVRLIKREAVG